MNVLLIKVFNGDVNLTIGGFTLSLIRSKIFSCSNPYLQGSIGFSYKEVDAYVPFTRLTAPFTIQVWFVICILLIMSMMIILLTKKLTRQWRHFIIGGQVNRTPILNMWSSVLGLPICNWRICNGGRCFGTFARTLAMLWMIAWFIIRNSYQGSLYTYLQSHRVTSAYDTIEKIRTSGCKILATPTVVSLMDGLIDPQR